MITTVMAVLAGIAAFAIAIKSLPTIWEAAKSFYKFLIGIEKATAIPELLINQQIIMDSNHKADGKLDETLAAIATISRELREHMLEEEQMRATEKDLVQTLVAQVETLSKSVSHNSSRIANVVFRQAVFGDSMAYYTMECVNGEWEWTWGNKAYLNLTGLTTERAMSGHYWDVVKDDQRDWVVDYASGVGEKNEPLDMDFTLVNMKTKEEHEVRVLAWPLHDNEGNAIVYLGAIEKKIDHARFEKS